MITAGLTDTFRAQLLGGGAHRPEHEYRLALYPLDAEIGPETASYEPAGEVQGQGYPPGGFILSGRRMMLTPGGVASMSWADVVADPATIEAAGGMVYNASLPGAPSVVVLDFGGPVSSTNGPFRVPLTNAVQWGRS